MVAIKPDGVNWKNNIFDLLLKKTPNFGCFFIVNIVFGDSI